MSSPSPVAQGARTPWWREARDVVRESLSGEERDYTRGSVDRAIILLAIPMMLEMSMESLFAIVDIFFVARLGAEAVAVVGLTEAVLTLVYAVGIGLSMGTTALVARRIGERDIEGARMFAAQTLWLGLTVTLAIAVGGVIFAADILRLMGAAPEVVETGRTYVAIMMGGTGTILFLFLINAIFRGAGDAAVAMRAMWLANGINIVLDPCLIYGLGPFPELGLEGAAVATTLGRGIGVVYQLYCLCGGRGRIRLGLRHLVPVPSALARLVRVSAGGVGQFLIATSSWIVLMRLVAPYGSAAIAGYTIGIRILAFTFLPAWGLGNAAATLVGQNLGAGQPERAERSVWRAARFNAAFLVTVGVFSILFTPEIIGLFTTDPAVLRHGVACLRITAWGYGFYAVGLVVVQAFNGAGDTTTPTIINFFCFWMLQIPLAYVLATQVALGPDGVFAAILISESVLAVVGVLVFRRGRWQRTVV